MNRNQEYDALKYKYDQAQRRLERLEEVVKLLEHQLKEKREQIAVLERVSNVVLWEREKKKLLQSCKDEQESLKLDLEQIQGEYINNKSNSKKVIQNLQEQIKKYELMLELELRQSKEDHLKELDKVRQELHVKRTTVAGLERELTEQQKSFVGVLRGLRVDFRILMQKSELGGNKQLWKKYSSMVDALYSASASGTLPSVRATLPIHYVGLAADITGYPVSLRRRGLGSSNTVNNTSMESINSLNGSVDLQDDDDRKRVERENSEKDFISDEKDHGSASVTSLPVLAATNINLTSSTTSFIVEIKEKLQSHSQLISQSKKTLSEVDLCSAVVSGFDHKEEILTKHFTTRQRSHSVTAAKTAPATKENAQINALVSPLIQKKTAKTAWRSPKPGQLNSSSYVVTPRGNVSPAGSKRNATTTSPLVSRSSVDMKVHHSSPTPSKMSQISLNYQEKGEVESQARRKHRVAASRVHRRKENKADSSPSVSVSSQNNPCLVDKENGILKIREVMTSFPDLTEEQVRGHFENFMKYDTNNDYALDFIELTTATTRISDHGIVVSKQELLEVLEEIDADFSNSIEFYDYLVLSKKCNDLSGASALFKNEVLVKQHKELATMCCVQ